MPVLDWIGKDKVVNHHLDVPYRVLERQYSYDEKGQHKENNGSENMIIHGDNLEALKSLLPQYEGKIDCIYIDPPYNTGNENWTYNDNVNDPRIKRWLGQVVGSESEDLSRHDKWLCMMYPRLKLLQRLLSDDGAIFISIDDNEQANLKLICDEIFGRNNFVAQLVWEKKKKGSFLSNQITNIKEYIIVYCNNKDIFSGLIGEINTDTETYPCINASNKRSVCKISKGIKSNYKEKNYIVPAGTIISDSTMYIKYLTDLVIEDGIVAQDFEVEGNWRYKSDAMYEYSQKKELYITNALYIRRIVSTPRYKTMKDLLARVGNDENTTYNTPININNLFDSGWGSNEDADNELINFFGTERIFSYPKPVRLIQKLICSMRMSNAIVLDSFAGSGTTAHAILNLNKQDNGHRKFIMIEMMDYADTVTAERVKRVISGTDGFEALGGNFSYYELGEALIQNGLINENVSIDKIREYVYFTETKQKIGKASEDEPYLLGAYTGNAYYFYYDKDNITTLDRDFLHTIKTKMESYVIYADLCTLSNRELEKYHISFKKIPRDISKL